MWKTWVIEVAPGLVILAGKVDQFFQHHKGAAAIAVSTTASLFKMLDFSAANLRRLALCWVGNKSRYEGVNIPKQTLVPVHDVAHELLIGSFLKPFEKSAEAQGEAIASADARVEGQVFPTYIFVGR